jgi:hypothetical protein
MVVTRMTRQTDAWHPEVLAVWPDGFWVPPLELRSGEYNHHSDDFEVVPHEGPGTGALRVNRNSLRLVRWARCERN